MVAASFEVPTLVTIAGDLTNLEIYASVDETDIGKVAVGQKATFKVAKRATLLAARQSPRTGNTSGEVTKGRPSVVWKLGDGDRPEPITVGIGLDDGSQVAVLNGPLRLGQFVIVNQLSAERTNRLFGITFGFFDVLIIVIEG
jgi:hypothetical protein